MPQLTLVRPGFLLVCAALTFGSLASSATAHATEPSRRPPSVPVTEFRFDDELVPGDYASPEGEVLEARLRAPRQSLIRVRPHFVPEMLKSVEDM